MGGGVGDVDRSNNANCADGTSGVVDLGDVDGG